MSINVWREDINSCEAPWRRRLAVIIQMKDYEKGRAVTPPGGPKEPDARRDVWLLVTAVSRQESAPSAGIAPCCVWGLFQPYLQHNSSFNLVITQAYELLSSNIFQEEAINGSNNEEKWSFTISTSVLVAAPSLHLATKADGGPIYPLVYWTERIR